MQYRDLRLQRRRLRRTYLGFLLLLTVGVLFASTWLALYLSKMVTRPLVALAEATQEISRGRLDYRVDVHAGSEIGQLVESFNRMAADLETSRGRIEASRRELADMNAQLEQRTRHIETILESVPSGVLSLDASRHIVHSNAAVRRLLRLDENPPVSAQSLSDLFPEDAVGELEHMLRKADRMGTTTSQLEIVTPRVNLNVAVTVASLDPPSSSSRNGRQRMGYVVVLEDLTDILRAQKQTAWREVARRIAHEIKNPLTPLALSAERIRRHLERGAAPDAASLSVIRQCAATISSSVETVRKLVDEFSTLARFPASKPQPSDINAIVNQALLMFDGRLDGIRSATIPGSGFAAGASRSGSHQTRGRQSGRQRRRSRARLVDEGDRHLHQPGRRPRLGRDRGRRHRTRRHARSQREALPALLLHQAARHRSGTGHRQPHRRRSSWLDPSRRELSRWSAIHRRVTCSPGNRGRGRPSRCKPF